MRDHPWSSTVTGADRQFGALLAAAEAERDRYQLLLNVNNAVVTCLGLRSLLHATSDSLPLY
jgi:hypothetical protein